MPSQACRRGPCAARWRPKVPQEHAGSASGLFAAMWALTFLQPRHAGTRAD